MARAPKRKVAAPGARDKVVGYVRVSTEDQKLGPVAQRDAIEEWCKKHGATLVALESDIGFSGDLPPEDRPGLMASIKAVEDHGAGIWLALKRDRIGRDPRYTAVTELLIERVGGKVLTVEDGDYDPQDATAMLVRSMRDVFARMELMSIRSRIKAAFVVKRSRGERLGQVPYGKRLLSPDAKVLVEDEREQAAITRAQALRAEGLGYREVALVLAAEGHPARVGHKYPPTYTTKWHPQAVKRITSG